MIPTPVFRHFKRWSLRRGVGVLAAFLAVSGLAACTNFFGDSKRGDSHIKVQSSVSCLNQVGETASDYVAGKVALAQMDALIDCTRSAVDQFTTQVRGGAGKANTYDRADITVFLDQFLLTSGKFDHQLLAMLFDLKASSIGGDADAITPSDIAKLKSLLSDFKTSMHEVDPYLEILTSREHLDPRAPADQQRFEAAITAFKSAIARLMPYVSPTSLRQRTFTMDEGFDLLASIGLDMKDKYKPYSNLSRIGKQVLVGGTPDIIRAEEWATLIKRAVEGYVIYLRYQTMIEPTSVTDPAIASQLHRLADEGIEFIEKSVRQQNSQVLTQAQLQQVISGLATAHILPLKLSAENSLSAEAISVFLPTVISKWLLDRTVANPVSSGGIGAPELKTLEWNARNWLAGLDLINTVSPGESIGQDDLKTALLEQSQKSLTDTSAEAALKRNAANEWVQIFAQGRSFAFESHHYIVLAPQKFLPPLQRADLVRMNLWRVVVEAVLRAYPVDLKRAQSLAGLTSDEVQQVYLDIRKVANEARLIDPRTFDAGTRTFMETNLFTSAANGDKLTQYREAIDWINSAVSAAMQATMIYHDIQKQCPAVAALDVLKQKQINVVCFRKAFRKGFAGYFKNLPGLETFFHHHLQDDASWTQFITAFETIARSQGAVDGPLDLGSFRTLVTVIGYSESLFTRFDADQNQLLTDSELWTAFPLVQPLIQQAMDKVVEPPFTRGQCPAHALAVTAPKPSADWLQKGVFAYLIQNGQPPPASGVRSLGVPLAFAKSYVLNAKITRLDLIKIIASFTQVNKQKQTDAINAFYGAQQATLNSDLQAGVCTVVQKTLSLFKCDPSAGPLLVQMVRAKSSQIFAAGAPETAAVFTKALEQELQNDPALMQACSPF